MTQPIEVDLPHNLGKDEARRRIANNIHKLAGAYPRRRAGAVAAGPATSSTSTSRRWASRSRRRSTSRTARCTCKVLLPGMLGMFAGLIQAALQKKGNVLLEDHSK